MENETRAMQAGLDAVYAALGGRFSVDPPEEPATCECRPCARCDGEGGRDLYQQVNGHNETWLGWEDCRYCKGTGQDSEDCGIHGRD